MIPYGRQSISEQDIASVLEVLRSDFLTQGPKVPAFEQAVAASVDAEQAVAVNSATSALHIACLALGLGEGDWLWTSPNTFVASANCALYCGAQVDFVDIDPDSYNLCPIALEAKLIQAEISGRLPKIVIPVHFAGQPCDMKRISQLSQRYGFQIIEDASHAIGGRYLNEPIGNCRYSAITVFSFHPVKIITTAEGGMAVTNSAELAEKMRLYLSHAVSREESLMTHPADGPWYYQQIDLGFNYRMTELQAALGLSQLERLQQFVEQRHQRAAIYFEKLQGLPIKLPVQADFGYSALHLFPIQVLGEKVKETRLALFEFLRQREIGVNVHYIPVHTQPYYQKMGFNSGDYPLAESYYQGAISLPLFAQMTDQQQQVVIQSIKDFFA